MPIAYNQLLSGSQWHSGNQNLTYSFLGSPPPTYYPNLYDSNSDGTNDSYLLTSTQNGPIYIPFNANAGLTPSQQSLALHAIDAWNEVAHVNLVPGGSGNNGSHGSAITGNGTLVRGLGGATGFGETAVPRNDDGSTSYDISAVFENGLNFFGNTFSSFYVNTNGNISFGSGIGTFTPSQITAGSTRMIAPFWADVDTRTNGAPDSEPIYLDVDPTNDVVTVTWSNVGYYNTQADRLNSFQLQLFDRGSGNFDIVFRYENINWTTGSASGGTGGLGGTPAHAGWTAGNQSSFFEVPGSGSQDSMLALETTTGNTGVTGLWTWQVRNGAINAGDVTFGAYTFTNDPGLYGFAYFPAGGVLGTPSYQGDFWINNSNTTIPNAVYGDDGWQTYLHELGHALGLSHPTVNGNDDPNNTAGNANNNNQWTVMSYVAHPNAGSSDVWPVTPMPLDIQAIQSMYGANYGTRNTGTTYFGPALAGTTLAYALGDGGTMQFDTNQTANGNGRVAMLTIWDGGGTDWINASNQTQAVSIDLTPGHFSTIGPIADNIGIAFLDNGDMRALIENAIGGSGNDTILGNIGANLLIGGVGSDHLFGDNGNDQLDGGAGTDTLDGGAGFDFAAYNSATAGVTVDMTTPANSTGDAAGDQFVGIEGLVGSNYNDTLRGDAFVNSVWALDGNDALDGRGGNDELHGQNGNDTLTGGAGRDVLDGGFGFDFASYQTAIAGLTADEMTPGVNTGDAQGDQYFSIEGLVGTNYDDVLRLDGFANSIWALNGNDTLDGRGGADDLHGQGGVDQLIGGAGADILDGGDGFDFASYITSANGLTVNLILTANNTGDAQGDSYVAIEGIVGSEGSDSLYANSGNNSIWALGGNDVLVGYAGVDDLHGQNGNDYLDGGTGSDTLEGGSGNDTFVLVRGQASDYILDFAGNGAAAGDQLRFYGFGTAAQGAHLAQIGPQHWAIVASDNSAEVFALANGATIHPSDYVFA